MDFAQGSGFVWQAAILFWPIPGHHRSMSTIRRRPEGSQVVVASSRARISFFYYRGSNEVVAPNDGGLILKTV